MALSRRTGQRFQGSIWPGFVDAMTGLLLVLMFVLTIFMVVQFVLRETISGQESELDALAGEVSALAQALGLEERENTQLEARMGALTATLSDRNTLIDTLTAERDQQAADLEAAQSRITGFEAQVAALLADRDQARADIADLENRQSDLLSEQEALNLALAQNRSEIDAQTEAARLAAAKREAMEALIADLQREGEASAEQLANVQARLSEEEEARLATESRLSEEEAARLAAESKLSDEEANRLAEAAAARALRERLQGADTELTAMTLALEAKRKEAEDTLTLLAAAEAARKKLDEALVGMREDLSSAQASALDRDALAERLAAALAAQQEATDQGQGLQGLANERAALLALAKTQLADEKEISAEAQRQTALLNQQVAALRTQLGSLQALLDDYESRDVAAQVQLQNLGADLNAALARAASEERKRRLLEEAERKRLEKERLRLEAEAATLAAQAQDLERYRSEFFGRLREVLGDQEGVRIEGDRFVFSSEVLFPPGGADLSIEGEIEIAKIANILRGIANEIPPEINWVIRVDGHTDNIPLIGHYKYADNWELSQGRALSVVRFMSQSLGIPPQRLAANGFGEYQPINLADTPEARAQNRRIELKLTEK